MKGTWGHPNGIPVYDYDTRVRRFPSPYADLADGHSLVRIGYSWQGTTAGDDQMSVIYGNQEKSLVRGLRMRVPSVEIGNWLSASLPDDFATPLQLHAGGFIAAGEEVCDYLALLERVSEETPVATTVKVDRRPVGAEIVRWGDCSFVSLQQDGLVVTIATTGSADECELTTRSPADGALMGGDWRDR